MPVLFFFSGLHGDYHKPSDTADKIDAADAAKLLDYVAEIATHLADDPERPKFVRVARPPAGPVSSGAERGPAMARISAASRISTSLPRASASPMCATALPAAKAGLKAGDILIEFDGKEIGNLYDFTYALREAKPGDEVLVKVLRGDQTIEAKVLLTERR